MEENVAGWDAALRGIVAVGVAAAIVFGLDWLEIDWALSVLLLGGVVIAYLALTAVAKTDLFYVAFGWNTRRRRGKFHRPERGARPARPLH